MSEKMRWVPTSKPVEVNFWYWRDEEEFGAVIGEAIRKAVADSLAKLLRENPPELSLPIHWASVDSDGTYGPPVKDPATIYLHLPFDENNDSEHVYEISLAAMIADAFWGEHEFEQWDTDQYEPTEQAFALAGRLRELADLIERGPDDWGEKHS
jgi:hypothetical protein